MARQRGHVAWQVWRLFAFLFCLTLPNAASVDLSQWIVQHGGTIGGIELRTDPVTGYRGWYARTALTSGLRLDQGLMLLLPSKLIFSVSTVRSIYASDVLSLLQQFKLRTADDGFVIIVIGWMLERAKGTSSLWAPCIELVSHEDQFLHLPRNPFVAMPDLFGLSPFYTVFLQAKRQEILDTFAELDEHLFPMLPLLRTLTMETRKALFVWAYLFQFTHGIQGSPDGQGGPAEEMMMCGINFLNHDKKARQSGPVDIDGQQFWGSFITHDHVAGEEIFSNYDSQSAGQKAHCNTDLFLRYGYVIGTDHERDCFHVMILTTDVPDSFELGPTGEMCKPEHVVPLSVHFLLQDPIDVTYIKLYSPESPHACTYHLLLAVFRREYHNIVQDSRDRLGSSRPNMYQDSPDKRARQQELHLGHILRGQLRVLGESILELQILLTNLAETGHYHRTLLERPAMYQQLGQQTSVAYDDDKMYA